MQWDHLPGFVKTGNLGDLARKSSRKRLLEEMSSANSFARTAVPYVQFEEDGA